MQKPMLQHSMECLVTSIGQLFNWIIFFLHLLEICQEDLQKTSESPSLMRVEMERRTRILLKWASSKTSVGTVEGLAIIRRLARTHHSITLPITSLSPAIRYSFEKKIFIRYSFKKKKFIRYSF